MRGYFNDEDRTKETIAAGWLHTRDVGYQDEDGYIFLLSRKSDMIIRGGENIAPEEIEEVLMSHPAVIDSVVVGVPDAHWGEQVYAGVRIRPGGTVSEADLYTQCESLASYKRPERIVVLDEIPRNPMGKLVRTRAREVIVSGLGL
jgi:acyl-CoA synthetase (AMP-forming)/AMP-acid ligase II